MCRRGLNIDCHKIILSDALDNVRVESQDGKEKFILGQVAQTKLNNGMFIVDMNSSPEVCFNDVVFFILSVPLPPQTVFDSYISLRTLGFEIPLPLEISDAMVGEGIFYISWNGRW